jgi:hypothetical protein
VSTTDNLSVWFLHVRSTSSSRYADVYEIAYTDGASAVTLRVDHDHDKCATLTDTARAEHAEARRHGIPTSRSDAAWTILKDLTQPRPGTGRQPVIVTTDATHTIAVLDRLARLRRPHRRRGTPHRLDEPPGSRRGDRREREDQRPRGLARHQRGPLPARDLRGHRGRHRRPPHPRRTGGRVIHVDHALAIAIGAALVGFLAGCVAAFGVLYDPTASKENHRDHNDH